MATREKMVIGVFRNRADADRAFDRLLALGYLDSEVNVLMSMENVTAKVQAGIQGAKDPKAELAARKKVIADIERESTEKTGLRSDVVSLYNGGEYWLYRYKKYTDVRLVFAFGRLAQQRLCFADWHLAHQILLALRAQHAPVCEVTMTGQRGEGAGRG